MTIIDAFKPATVLLKAKDNKSGKLLPGATVNIGTGDTTVVTLTTGSTDTASAQLPVNSRTGTPFWAKQTRAPAGYAPSALATSFTAKPGSPVTVTLTHTRTTTPTPSSTEKPSGQSATGEPAPDQPAQDMGGGTSSAPPGSAVVNPTRSSSSTPIVKGTLARTGADAALWLLGGAGFLLALGTGTAFAARRQTDDPNGPFQD
ncbi:hypothetical protein AB0D14_32535 [Streptomyces sp. NPDC048484]|uniref:hypothetical protein n=1 Tax=Streptomyces sp. NPDC048484 TaxID=3155146 RepID=UPI00341E0A61